MWCIFHGTRYQVQYSLCLQLFTSPPLTSTLVETQSISPLRTHLTSPVTPKSHFLTPYIPRGREIHQYHMAPTTASKWPHPPVPSRSPPWPALIITAPQTCSHSSCQHFSSQREMMTERRLTTFKLGTREVCEMLPWSILPTSRWSQNPLSLPQHL